MQTGLIGNWTSITIGCIVKLLRTNTPLTPLMRAMIIFASFIYQEEQPHSAVR